MIDHESLTGKQVAEIWGVVPMTVSQWHTRDGCPRSDKGKYSLSEVIRWRESRLVAKDAAYEAGPDGKFTEHQLRKQKADADAAEFRLGVMQRRYYPTELIDQWFFGLASGVKVKLLQIPSVMAPELYGREIPDIAECLTEAVERIINELHEATKPLPPEESDE